MTAPNDAAPAAGRGRVVQCHRCKQMRPSLQSVNIAPDAACTGPAIMAPICEACAARGSGLVERLGDTVVGLLTCGEAAKDSTSWRLEATGALSKLEALARTQAARIAELERDALALALVVLGISPDRNTQAEAEAEATLEAARAIAARHVGGQP